MIERIKVLLKHFIKDETGGALLVSTPFFSVLFMLMVALVFNVAIWLERKQELQYITDAASRAGTLAIERSFPVLETNGKYHVYAMLNPSQASSNADKVLNKSKQYLKGMEITNIQKQPSGFKSPEWSSREHRYYDKYLTVEKQYQNGDFSVYTEANIEGVWTKFLGVEDKIKVKAYAQSMASGTASR